MACPTLLPEAEKWLARQEEIELPQLLPQPVRKKPAAFLDPILRKERIWCEERMRRDVADHGREAWWNKYRNWCCKLFNYDPATPAVCDKVVEKMVGHSAAA